MEDPSPADLRDPEKELILISAYDGIGGARRALELLCLTPKVFISLEHDEDCAAVVKRAWEDVVHLSDVADLTEQRLREILRDKDSRGTLTHGLLIGGPPCQGLSGINVNRKGMDDPRSQQIYVFAELAWMLQQKFPRIRWDFLMENVASMDKADRLIITDVLQRSYRTHAYRFYAA